jgi:hypothetical protein
MQPLNQKPDITIPHHFEAREYQIPFLYEVERAITGESKIRNFVQVWHRRSGKDKSNIADVVPRRLLHSPCLVKYVYPTLVMGRDNLWEGIGSDGFKYRDHIPKGVRAGVENNTRMTIPVKNETCVPVMTDTSTPSIFQIDGSDNPDKLRGGNPKMYIFSEWSEQNPYAYDVIEPILQENDGICIFNYTPKGDNHARGLLDFARKHSDTWYAEVLTALDTGIFDERKLEEIRQKTVDRFVSRGRSETEAIAYFEQEYLCSFDAPVIGSYYGAAIQTAQQSGRIREIAHNPDLPVITFWDLGVGDSNSIWFMQPLGNEFRFIDYLESSNVGLDWYIAELRKKPYNYTQHFAPHDIEAREYTSGVSRLNTARKMGINFTVVPQDKVDDGIDQVRRLLKNCWFDEEKCKRGVECLKNYKKVWDERLQTYREIPLHDWSSHGADAFRQFAMGYGRFHVSDVGAVGDLSTKITVTSYGSGVKGSSLNTNAFRRAKQTSRDWRR